ncbi:hypothetical protein Amsp01_086340 [Amycolatopsis sp. NBRC 101858]|uniref:hypothetical protein n=1 Tax=Amycolatopsis sp. NBRC 101858 TaxID=3032200 RepID=UPI00249FEFEB|nr:hypothetical protein [Amycolatopsis sp. NBRC 101858]GLY42611.1 hypothetical protein Amsp01_086340 [Amycolatopsis sp. NBRC 101858]
MTSDPGHRLLDFLRDLRAATAWQVVTEDTGTGSKWQLGGVTWRATVLVERRWLGLQFEAWEPVTGRRATYDIDTDLYDISRDAHREFAEEIERDIIEFLGNLKKGLVGRGTDGAKFVLVFPLDGSFVRVVQGRFATSASTHADLAAALAGGGHVPVA